MLEHYELACYVESLTDAELLEFAARVTAWRLLLEGEPFDEVRRMILRCLAACSNGFADRELNTAHGEGGIIPPGSRWEKVHARAAALRADGDAARARKQIAAWARTVRLAA